MATEQENRLIKGNIMLTLADNKVLDKSCKIPLTVQLADTLKKDIINGKLVPGKRIPGVRRLMRQYNVSINTVIEALNLMEQQNYVEKIPTKGTFVTDDVNHELSLIKIALVFPEEAITLENVHSMENYVKASSIYHGAINEAKQNNTEITFLHFNEPENEIQLSRQMRRLEPFDGVFFIGFQLETIIVECTKKAIPCVLVGSFYDQYQTDCILVEDDVVSAMESICAHLAERGFKKVVSFLSSCSSPIQKKISMRKIKILNEKAHKYGITATCKDLYFIDNTNDEQINRVMAQVVASKEKIAIFSAHTSFVPLIYRFCRLNNYPLGDKVGAFGYSSGVDYMNLDPPFTYVKGNCIDRGRMTCRLLVDVIRNKSKQKNQLIKGQLIIGETT